MSNFKVTGDKKLPFFLTQIECFRTVTPVWIHQWLWYDAQSLTYMHNTVEVPYYFSRSSVKFQGHTGQKISPILTRIGRFPTVTPIWIHPWLWNDAQSLLCIEEVTYCFPWSSMEFKGHTGQKLLILTRIGRFWTVTLFEFTDGFEMMHKAWHSI